MLPCLPTMRFPEAGGVRSVLMWATRAAAGPNAPSPWQGRIYGGGKPVLPYPLIPPPPYDGTPYKLSATDGIFSWVV